MKTTMTPEFVLSDLLLAAEEACNWLCEAPKGTDQYERGVALKEALNEARHIIEAAPNMMKAVRGAMAYLEIGTDAEAHPTKSMSPNEVTLYRMLRDSLPGGK